MKLRNKLTTLIAAVSAIAMAHPGHHHDIATKSDLGHIICSVLFVAIVAVAGVYAFRSIKKKQKNR